MVSNDLTIGDIRVNYLQSQQLNIPFDITVTTTYPSQSDLVFTFLGNFEFSPATITLAANQTAVTVSALPLAAGSNNFRVVYSGLEAGAYQTTGDWNVDVAKCMCFCLFIIIIIVILFFFVNILL